MNRRPAHLSTRMFGEGIGLYLHVLIMAAIIGASILQVGGCGQDQPDASPRQDASSQQPTRYVGTIVAVGDSLTAGLGVEESEAYPARLEKKLQKAGYPYRVINAGVSGETSSGALSRIQWVISSLKPDIVILETGANDGLRGIDPSKLHENLEQLVTTLKQQDIVVVLAGMKMLPNLGPDYIQRFEAIFPRIAGKHDLIYIPFFLEGVAGRPEFNQSDGIHPTAEGYARIADRIWPYVIRAIENFSRQQKS